MAVKWEFLDSNKNFHDSHLLQIKISPQLDSLHIVIFSPWGKNDTSSKKGKFYLLKFNGILRLEFETLRTELPEVLQPIEIYDIILLYDKEQQRWEKYFESFDRHINVHHVILCSSLICGWGENIKRLEGISLICQDIEIDDVTHEWPDKYRFYPPVIEGKKDDKTRTRKKC